jgi:hypothetical protein
MTDSVIGRIAALKTTPTLDLRAMWRDLFDSEPPRYNELRVFVARGPGDGDGRRGRRATRKLG